MKLGMETAGCSPNPAFGPGKKYDTGKLRWDLLPISAVMLVVTVLTFGSVKYGDNNWQNVEPFDGRYFAALHRHLAAWRAGERLDPETGLPHLAHAACCVLFLLSREIGFDPVLDGDSLDQARERQDAIPDEPSTVPSLALGERTSPRCAYQEDGEDLDELDLAADQIRPSWDGPV